VGGDDHQGIADRRRPAGEPCAATAGHERTVVAGGDPDGGGDVRPARGEAHGGGFTPVHARVTLVQRQLEWLGPRPPRPQCGLEVGYERVDITAGFDM
jgi:hypothetical protein